MKNMFKNFEEYLINQVGISKSSLKYYRSDLSHFKQWIILKIKTLGILAENLSETVPFISRQLAKEYKEYLLTNNIAVKTSNRRLSTLRHFARFLVLNDIVNFDFMEDIENSKLGSNISFEEKIIQDFANFLSTEKVSQNTSKNYIADIKQFMSWLQDKNLMQTKI
jgi:site-specific recombinase XerD